MLYLIEAAQQYGLNGIVEQAMSNKNAHGVMIGVDSLWLKAWNLHLTNPNNDKVFRHLIMDYDFWLYKNSFDSYDLSTLSFSVGTKMDIYWLPPEWSNFRAKSNLVVTILLRPGSERIPIKYEGQLTILQEHRPVPVMSANAKGVTRPLQGGISIGNNSNVSGTLGGILINPQTGKKYGVTCAHVINSIQQDVYQPSLKDSNNASIIGKSILIEGPAIKGTGLCNQYNPGMLFNEMDLALIEIDENINANLSVLNIGRIKGITPPYLLQSNLSTQFNGRSSEHKTSLVLGKIGVVNEVENLQGVKHCFNHLIELKQPSIFNLALERPVQPGDSGAWVTVQGASGLEWCAMIIGEDRQTGYAILSSSIQGYLQSKGFLLNCC